MNGHSRIARQAGTSFLTADEERAAWATGDKDRVITAHMHLARRIAETFARAWRIDAEELTSEAYVGLCRAAAKFEPKRGVRFHHYASFWCKAMILKFIMDNWRMVKIGTTQVQRKLFFVLHSTAALVVAGGEIPTAEILAEILDCTEEQIIEMQQRLGLPDVCLDQPVGTDGDATLGDFMIDEDQDGVEDIVAQRVLTERVAAVVTGFIEETNPPARDRAILYKRLYTSDPVTLQEIGDQDGVTRERVRQCEARLVAQLKDYIEDMDPDLAGEVDHV